MSPRHARGPRLQTGAAQVRGNHTTRHAEDTTHAYRDAPAVPFRDQAGWEADARDGRWPAVCAGCAQRSVDRVVGDVEQHLAAARRGWRALLLADELGSPPHWRLAWLLHGLPEPLPREEYAAALGLVERRFGIGTVVRGLRLAAGMPAPHGSGVRPSEFGALADRIERAAREATQ